MPHPLYAFSVGRTWLWIAAGFGLLSLAACQDPTEPPTPAPVTTQPQADVIVAQTPASIPPASVGLKKVEFPVFLAGVPSLLHPIVPSVPLEGKMDGGSKSREGDTAVSYFQETSPYHFQSSVYNLVFEDIETGTTKRLFPHDNFVIKSAVYPFVEGQTASSSPQKTTGTPSEPTDEKTPTKPASKSDKIMLKHFIYEVKERPSDDDSKTNIDEQLALYMSDDTGNDLVKLHPNNQYIKSGYWLPQLQRYYFTTQADTNSDGLIDANDKSYNYVIDFANPTNTTDKDGKTVRQQPKILAYTFLK